MKAKWNRDVLRRRGRAAFTDLQHGAARAGCRAARPVARRLHAADHCRGRAPSAVRRVRRRSTDLGLARRPAARHSERAPARRANVRCRIVRHPRPSRLATGFPASSCRRAGHATSASASTSATFTEASSSPSPPCCSALSPPDPARAVV